MTTTYLTGSRYPSPALKAFLPDYLDLLIQRGEQILTSNKPGVDRFVIQHCDQNELPLQVCDFIPTTGYTLSSGRRVKTKSESVQVKKIVAPGWQRFRHILEAADKLCFFHAAKIRGEHHGLSSFEAFEKLCEKRNIPGEQYIVQLQMAAWVNVAQLRKAPILGPVHIYLYSRYLPGLDGNRYCVGQFRIESWREIGEIVQPGEGRREFVIAWHGRRHYAELQLLEQALLELESHQPERLVIHYENKYLQHLPYRRGEDQKRQQAVRKLLDAYPKVVWVQEKPDQLRERIGKHISQGQELWNHKKRVNAFKGLYE